MRAILLDMLYGFLYGLVSCVVLGWLGVLVAIVTSLLWCMGGIGVLGYNLWRRIGCPLMLAGSFALADHSLIPVVSGLMQYGAFCIGYGRPSTQPYDKGSWLGRTFAYPKLVWFGILAVAMVPLFL